MRQVCATFIASLSVAITLASNQAFGQLRAASPGGSPPRSAASPQPNIGTFFPAVGGFFGGPFSPQPNINLDVRQTITDGIYTCTYYIPWDWVHRCPPIVSPPVPPPPPVAFRPGCSGQTVTVPGLDGKDQTVNMLLLRKSEQCNRYVRFTPKSGHVRCNEGCPLWANSGHSAPNPRVDRNVGLTRGRRTLRQFS
jgi:hypothetical protein